MKGAELQAIYMMWLREMKRYMRSRSRIIGTIVQPMFFLVILGSGLRSAAMPGIQGGDYLFFLAPGIVAMAILFSAMFTGVSVLWDRQFGFLQEVLVAPISRLSIIFGRTIGGATISLIQGFIILTISVFLGVPILSIPNLILTIAFMVLLAFTAVGFGLVIASKMTDFQGFQVIMNLIIMPLLFLSSAFFPISTNPNFPAALTTLVFVNPLFYMVDGLRGAITGVNNTLPPMVNLFIVLGICIFMMGIGSYLFNKCEA